MIFRLWLIDLCWLIDWQDSEYSRLFTRALYLLDRHNKPVEKRWTQER
jgi:hypothetical protein